MIELKEFEFVNTCLTTIPQSKVISKIASHFHITNKAVREVIDKELLEKEAILSFSDYINDQFYVASVKLDIPAVYTPSKFRKSKLVEEYAIFDNKMGSKYAPFFVIYPAMLVVTDINSIKGGVAGFGGIYLNYYPEFQDTLLLPLDMYLKIQHPLPLA